MTSPSRVVLVTGATGFLGRRVAEALANEGQVVLGVSHRGGEVGRLAVDAVDLCSAPSVDRWRQGKPRLDAVVHLAACIPPSPEGPDAEEALVANLRMTRSALRIGEADRAGFVYASGTSVYGSLDGAPAREDLRARPCDLYTLSKHVGEELVELSRSTSGTRAIILRISAPYGPGQRRRTVVRTFLEAALHSKDITFHGSGSRVQDFTHVDDAAAAVSLALGARESGVFNISGGEPVSMRELAGLAQGAVPGSGSRIVASGQDDPQEGYRGRFAIEEAKRALGWVPRVRLREGLAEWARELKAEEEAART